MNPDNIKKLDLITELGLAVYTKEGYTMFLFTPLPRFDNRAAAELILEDKHDEVISFLATLYEGGGF